MLSALTWIPRGSCKKVPIRQEISKDEIEAMRVKQEDMNDFDNNEDNDDEDDDDEEEDSAMQGTGKAEDYVGKSDLLDDDEDLDDEDLEDAEDLEARPSDAFVVVANTEDEYSSLEVHCYSREDGSLYTHHDVTLPSFPLCLAWMDYAGDAAGALYTQTDRWSGENSAYVGSYVAVGSFEPDIEIWNLDVIDPLEPTLILKGAKASTSSNGGTLTKQSKKKNKGGKNSSDTNSTTTAISGSGADSLSLSVTGHTGAVMGLSWNRIHRHMLASSSADTTVKVWDLDGGGRQLHSYSHHKGKVQQVAWNPVEATVLAMASFDRTASVTDAREAEKKRIAFYGLTGEPECLLWNHLLPSTFIVSTDDGKVTSFDVRMPDKPLWRIQAHAQATTSVALSSTAEGLMATTSLDKSVKLWDMSTFSIDDENVLPLSSKTMSAGQLFTCSFYPNSPYLLAAGGSKGMLAIWDISEDGGDASTSEENVIVERFRSKLRNPATVPSLSIRPREDGQPL